MCTVKFLFYQLRTQIMIKFKTLNLILCKWTDIVPDISGKIHDMDRYIPRYIGTESFTIMDRYIYTLILLVMQTNHDWIKNFKFNLILIDDQIEIILLGVQKQIIHWKLNWMAFFMFALYTLNYFVYFKHIHFSFICQFDVLKLKTRNRQFGVW